MRISNFWTHSLDYRDQVLSVYYDLIGQSICGNAVTTCVTRNKKSCLNSMRLLLMIIYIWLKRWRRCDERRLGGVFKFIHAWLNIYKYYYCLYEKLYNIYLAMSITILHSLAC